MLIIWVTYRMMPCDVLARRRDPEPLDSPTFHISNPVLHPFHFITSIMHECIQK